VTTLVIGTRGSALALRQSELVRWALEQAWPGLVCELLTLTTAGDRQVDRPLPEIGGKGLFTHGLEQALLEGRIDLAVHSLKDLPTESVPGLVVGAIPSREDARDALVSPSGWTLATLPSGARVGTCSLRRAAQLLAIRPDLDVAPVRGNVDTRLRQADQGHYHALILAVAGLKRLGRAERITQALPLDLILPAPGQGALAVQCRAADRETLARLQPLDHPAARAAVTAEREYLSALGGGCSGSVAAYGLAEAGAVTLAGRVSSPDGRRAVNVSGQGHDPQTLGRSLAQQALDRGAAEWLA
jgi:hydroxymethylbilane synthase